MAAEKKWQVFFPRRGLDAILFIFPPPAFFPSLVCGKLFGWLRKASSASKTRLKDVFRGRGGGRSRQRREILAWWRRFRAISFLSITYSSRKDDDSSKKIPFLCFFFDSLILKCKEIRKAWINIHQRFNIHTKRFSFKRNSRKNRSNFPQRHVWTFSNPIPGSRAAESFSPFLPPRSPHASYRAGRKRICCVKEKRRRRRRRRRPVRTPTWGDASSNHCAFAAAAVWVWGENFFSFSSAGLGKVVHLELPAKLERSGVDWKWELFPECVKTK